MSSFDRLDQGASNGQRFYGKYEAVVTDVGDPLNIGRIRARVPAVFGLDIESGWALPCAPFGGGKNRGFFFLPGVGDTVWIEFAAGDVSRPIWAGTFWGAPESAGGQDDLSSETGSEVPSSDEGDAGPKRGILRTTSGHCIVLDDDGGVIVIANGGGSSEVRITKEGDVIIKASNIKFGSDSATEPLVLGQSFMQFFNTHTHPTGVGPSGPPAQPMMTTHLSQKVKTE